ncbi:hypothetical protein, partial [uncultured Gimesia sp.]|uniref:hypothetical protein n=1 Tax=uncultured Gimesia sp. TaxID=1678688 RepID=UPI002606A606
GNFPDKKAFLARAYACCIISVKEMSDTTRFLVNVIQTTNITGLPPATSRSTQEACSYPVRHVALLGMFIFGYAIVIFNGSGRDETRAVENIKESDPE